MKLKYPKFGFLYNMMHWLGYILLLMTLLFVNSCQNESNPQAQLEKIQYNEIINHVFLLINGEGETNHAVVVGTSALLILDAPADGLTAKKLADYWQKLYPKLRPILVLSSSQSRDWEGYHSWKEAFPSLEVIMSSATLTLAAKDGITGGRALERAEILDLGGISAELIPMGPAATAGDLVAYLPQQKVLFSGDMVLDYNLPLMQDSDTAQWINRLQELATRGLDKIIPTHGKTLDIDALNWTRQYLVLLRSQICLLKGQGYANDDIYYFLRIPSYEKYTEGKELFKQNAYYVLKEIQEKGDVCTLPGKALPQYGPVPIQEAQK